MARAIVPEQPSVTGPVTDFEARHVLRSLPPEKERRYPHLTAKRDQGTLSRAERVELRTLVAESEQLMLDNAHALLRHGDPDAYADALREERRLLRGRRGAPKLAGQS